MPANNKINPLNKSNTSSSISLLENEESAENNILSEEDWIPKNISKRVCKRFVFNEDNKGGSKKCCCGYEEKEHRQRDINNSVSNQKWDANVDTVEEFTDAFGNITFQIYGSTSTSKFVRIDTKTKMETALQLLTDVWKLQKPNLLISVTGGAKNFDLKPKLKNAFRNGLLKAAYSTGAWIITGGSHAGVMKLVGEAVHDYAAIHGSKIQVTAIGVAPWGCVCDKDNLINPKGSWPVNFVEPPQIPFNQTALDPNHSHFLLVDNGTQYKFATEIPFRAQLEKAVSEMKTDTGQNAVTVPVVCVVIEGGPGTLETVKSAIQNGTPSVIVEGSGRAADILAYAYNHSSEDEVEVTDEFGQVHKKSISIIETTVWDKVKQMIIENFTDSNIDTRLSWVQECFNKRDHITIFRLDSKQDLDQALLQSLLKVNKDKSIDQLRLALAWNRVDIAKDSIFTKDQVWKVNELNDVFYNALLNNCVDFVKLLLENGVNLREFLSVEYLIRLYNCVDTDQLLVTLFT